MGTRRIVIGAVLVMFVWAFVPGSSVLAATTRLVMATAASTATAGGPFSFTVTAQDQNGNADPGYAGTLHFTSSDTSAGVMLPPDSQLSGGQGTFSATLIRAGYSAGYATTIVVSDAANSLSATLQVTVKAAPADHLRLAHKYSAIAGFDVDLLVSARDPYDNIDSSYAGTVHFATSDTSPGVVLPADSTVPNGYWWFSVVLDKAGPQTVMVADTVTPSITGTIGYDVRPAPAASIRLDCPPTANAGEPFDVTVAIVDKFGNVVTNRDPVPYTGTIHFTSGDQLATLPPDYAFTAGDNGVRTFSGVTLVRSGAQTITGTDTVNTNLTGAKTLTVWPGAASSIALEVPASATPAQPFTITLTLFDRFGNAATGTVYPYTGTVHFTSTDALATLPPDYTFTIADAGARSFSGVTLVTPGDQTISARDVANASITGTSPNIAVSLPLPHL